MNNTLSMVVLCSAAVLFGVTGCARYSSVTTETHAIPANSTVSVSSFNGSIILEWHDGSDMIIEITRTSSRSEEDLTKADVEIIPGMITSVEARRLDRDASIGVSLKISLPNGTQIDELRTSNGIISVNGGSGSVFARTSNGSITFDNFDGSVNAETSNGGISVSESNLVHATTSNGRISGEIHSIPAGGITWSTSNGSIDATIESGLDADLEMDTSNGSISISGESFADTVIDDSNASATLGAGGSSVILNTSNGSIRLTAD